MEELIVDLYDWVILKDGRTVQIINDEMSDVPYETIERHAMKAEILKAGGIPEDLAKRIYVFVPYNISDKQKGIQSLHAAQKYDRKYAGSHMLNDFIDNHMTCIMLDGGTTNSHPDRLGTLNKIYLDILTFSAECTNKEDMISFAIFEEPDLNDALTAVTFIADERVFDFETYPEFYDWLLQVEMDPTSKYALDLKNPILRRSTQEQFKMAFPEYYAQWVEEVLGGKKNELLRNLTRGKKLA